MDLPYQAHSETSRDAAESVQDVATLRQKVYDFLISRGPAIDERMQQGLRMGASTQRPRRVELVERGLVVDSGKREKTKSGRWATVWKAVASTGNMSLFDDGVPEKRALLAAKEAQLAKKEKQIVKLRREIADLRRQLDSCATAA